MSVETCATASQVSSWCVVASLRWCGWWLKLDCQRTTPNFASSNWERRRHQRTSRSFCRSKNSCEFLRRVGLKGEVLARNRFKKNTKFLRGVGLCQYRNRVGLVLLLQTEFVLLIQMQLQMQGNCNCNAKIFASYNNCKQMRLHRNTNTNAIFLQSINN